MTDAETITNTGAVDNASVKKVLLVGLGLVVLGGGVAYSQLNKKPQGPRFETMAVEKGPLVAKVTASGTLSALVTVQVGAQVSGRLREIAVDFNSAVKKGQLLAKLDPQLFVAALEQARANTLAAEANLQRSDVQLADAERQLARSKQIFEKQLSAQADLDTAQTTRDAAAAQVKASAAALQQAKAQLHQAEVNLDYCTILSPIDGVVISRAVDVGQTVAASLQAPTLFTIAEDLRKMQVDTNVSEADIGKISAGMEATFTVDAFPHERFTGKVRQIRNAPITVQNVVTYDAVIDVANPELRLKPGMTASVTFVVAQKDEALKVPNATLRFRPPQSAGRAPKDLEPNERLVWRPRATVEGAKPETSKAEEAKAERGARGERPSMEPLRVRIGMSDGSMTEIISGELKEGDLLITELTESGAPSGGPPRGGGMGRLF